MKKLHDLWTWIVNWFEYGDLVPLLVLVSAVHYADVLRDKDRAAVAIAIGLLVDLGHFRTVRAAFRYGGEDKRQAVARWLIAAGMTVISLVYHQRFYADLWLSLPIPLLIAALAWLQKVDQHAGAKGKPQTSEHRPTESETKPEPVRYKCEYCPFEARSQNALNAHRRKHSKPIAVKSQNGRVKEPIAQ